MTLAPPRERHVVDVLGATGGVRLPEPDVTGVETESLEGWLAGLAVSQPHARRYLLLRTGSRHWSPLRLFVGADPTCLAVVEEANTSMEPTLVPWLTIKAGEAVTATGFFLDRSMEPTVYESDWGWTSPVSLTIAESLPTATIVESPEATHSAELVEAAQQIRELTRLPVQDVSAMLGIKRRQFYNWLDGTLPTSDRIRRLFALRDAVSRLSGAAGGDPRRVRLALLAPISGDTVFDAFVADDATRIEASVGAAVRALAEGRRLVRRVPPSARARSAPGAAEELRLERDSLGLYPHSADPEEDAPDIDLDDELLGPLTSREREILQLLADGMSNVDVAERLLISQATVRRHVRHILAKLETVASTRDLAGEVRAALAIAALDSDDRS
jgi:DNA-binding NarL/FixJ family response regulator